jgi:phage head maturation protease
LGVGSGYLAGSNRTRTPFSRRNVTLHVNAGCLASTTFGFGTVQARIPEPDGETVITRYSLRELLDKLDELTSAHQDEPDGAC